MKIFWKRESEEVKRARMSEQNKTLKEISETLKKLNGLIENGNLGKLVYDMSGNSITTTVDYLKNNMVNRINVEEYVQKEIAYNKEYEKRWDENPDLIELITNYIKCDKYDIIKFYDELNKVYKVEKR